MYNRKKPVNSLLSLVLIVALCLGMVPSHAWSSPSTVGQTTIYEATHSSITYTGNWYSSGGIKHSSTVGNTAVFSFSGLGVKWLSRPDSNGGLVRVTLASVDDPSFTTETVTINTYHPQALERQIVFQKSHLDQGNYTLKLEILSDPNSSRVQGIVSAFEVVTVDETELPLAPQTVWAVPGNKRVELFWSQSESADVEGYNV